MAIFAFHYTTSEKYNEETHSAETSWKYRARESIWFYSTCDVPHWSQPPHKGEEQSTDKKSKITEEVQTKNYFMERRNYIWKTWDNRWFPRIMFNPRHVIFTIYPELIVRS